MYLAVSGLSCNTLDLVLNPGPLHWEHGVLATRVRGSPRWQSFGISFYLFLLYKEIRSCASDLFFTYWSSTWGSPGCLASEVRVLSYLSESKAVCLRSVSNFSPLFCFSWFCKELPLTKGFPAGAVEKKMPVSTGDPGDAGSIPGSGVGNGNPLQYSCLENSNGQRSLAGYSPWSRKESDVTECARACTHAHTHTDAHS